MAMKTDFTATEWGKPSGRAACRRTGSRRCGSQWAFRKHQEKRWRLPEQCMKPCMVTTTVRQICDREEIKASIESLKDMAKSSGDFKSIQSAIRKVAIDKSRAGLDLLEAQGNSGRRRCLQ